MITDKVSVSSDLRNKLSLIFNFQLINFLTVALLLLAVVGCGLSDPKKKGSGDKGYCDDGLLFHNVCYEQSSGNAYIYIYNGIPNTKIQDCRVTVVFDIPNSPKFVSSNMFLTQSSKANALEYNETIAFDYDMYEVLSAHAINAPVGTGGNISLDCKDQRLDEYKTPDQGLQVKNGIYVTFELYPSMKK